MNDFRPKKGTSALGYPNPVVNQSWANVEVAVLGSPSLIVRTVYVDVKQH